MVVASTSSKLRLLDFGVSRARRLETNGVPTDERLVSASNRLNEGGTVATAPFFYRRTFERSNGDEKTRLALEPVSPNRFWRSVKSVFVSFRFAESILAFREERFRLGSLRRIDFGVPRRAFFVSFRFAESVLGFREERFSFRFVSPILLFSGLGVSTLKRESGFNGVRTNGEFRRAN